jgi:hypothetical protein
MIIKTNVVACVAAPLHILGIDLLGEIFGWLSSEDLAWDCLASQYLLATAKMPSLSCQLRTQHSSRQRTDLPSAANSRHNITPCKELALLGCCYTKRSPN